MLNTMRQLSNNFVTKLIFGLIILSFVVWGIGDNFKSRQNFLVEIGDEHITKEDFSIAKKRKLEELQSLLGAELTEEQIQSLSVDTHVLNQLIDRKLIEIEGEALNLQLSDNTIIEQIKQTASFQNSEGKFDPVLFKKICALQGLSEADLVDIFRRDITSSNLVGSIMATTIAPNILTEYISKYQGQMRKISTIQINSQAVANPTPPTKKELEVFFQKNQNKYFIPEYREATYLELNNQDLLKNITITEEEAKLEYDSNLSDYYIEETRDIYNLFFQDKDKAEQALQLLNATKDFAQTVLETTGTKHSEALVAAVTKANLPQELQDSVFNLKAGEHTEIIKTNLGYHIISLAKITAAQPKSFEQVKLEIQQKLSTKKLEQELSELTQKIEDELGAGATLEEISQKLNLPLQQLSSTSSKGLGMASVANTNLPNYSNFLPILFSTAEKSESPLTARDDNSGYFVLRVNKITTQQPMTLHAARTSLLTDYITDQLHNSKKLLSEKIVKQINSGTKPSAIAIEQKLPFTRSILIERKGNTELTPTLVNKLFNKKLGEAAEDSDTEHNYTIGIVDEIMASDKPSAADLTKIKEATAKEMTNGLYQEYLNHLRLKHHVKMYNNLNNQQP
jgi:peptidyl-prolyl cis-trans isomerase D